jgi:hypothetical protein
MSSFAARARRARSPCWFASTSGSNIKRQVLAGTYPDLQHQTACGPDRPLAIGVQTAVPHRQINQTGHNPALIETHCAVLGEIKGAAGLVYLLGSMSASFRCEHRACPLECRVRSNSMGHPRRRIGELMENEAPPAAASTTTAEVTGTPLFAKPNWPKRDLTAANNARTSCCTSPRSAVGGLYTLAHNAHRVSGRG